MDNFHLWSTHPVLASPLSCQTRNIQKHKKKVKIDMTWFEVSNYAYSNTNILTVLEWSYTLTHIHVGSVPKEKLIMPT